MTPEQKIQCLSAMRDHLKKHWAIASQWARSGYANDGTPCMLVHVWDEYAPLFSSTISITRPLGISATDVIYNLNRKGGRENSLQTLERAIARWQEFTRGQEGMVPTFSEKVMG